MGVARSLRRLKIAAMIGNILQPKRLLIALPLGELVL